MKTTSVPAHSSLENWEVGNRVILKRYEDYVPRSDPSSNFAGAQIPYVDRIIWLEIPSEETKIAGLKTGEWDIVDGASLDYFPELEAHPEIGVRAGQARQEICDRLQPRQVAHQ